jgi:hypothetical protein
MMKKGVFFLIHFSLPFFAAAQEMWGAANSNFSGNMGMGLNPASMVASPYSSEFNLLSGDLTVQNNYIYIRKRSSGNAEGKDNRTGDYYTPSDKNGYGHINLRGPSFILNQGNYSIGFHLSLRTGLSAKDVPFHLAKFMYEGFDYEPQHDIHYTGGPFKAALIEWLETGMSIGAVLHEAGDNLLTGAFTLNYLVPFNAAYIDVNYIDYTVPDAMLLNVYDMDGAYAHTDFDTDGNIPGQIFSKKGSGFSADAGLQFYHDRLERAYACGKRSDDYMKYKYKIGFSAIDFGYVQLNKNAGVYSYDHASAAWPGIDTVKFNNITDFDTSMSNQFYGDPYASRSGNNFKMVLPAAVSLQFDVCFKPRWYVNASIIQRFPLGKNRILRPNQLSITPRYETRAFEIALPVSSYEYTLPRIGLALRYKFLVLGTDNIGAFTGLWDITGIDFYFGIKLQACNGKNKRVKGEDCFAY